MMFVESWCDVMKSTLDKESVPVLLLTAMKTWVGHLIARFCFFLHVNQPTKSEH